MKKKLIICLLINSICLIIGSICFLCCIIMLLFDGIDGLLIVGLVINGMAIYKQAEGLLMILRESL